ncbi:uncharacterized protein LOC111380239 [Olea europaea var. sylvestris]|uniref:uncharacterized protein LOC111380239 n=1 Tax=Olea europaea var. sylvestris TaxID=158386 RepID=UPI000C1D5336|nr:uncharacterized protein LOC111380239 [Olea europaea var. sylvestris]
MEELETFPVNPEDSNQVLRIEKSLSPEEKIEMIRFLKENLDVFAWKHKDIVGIDSRISCHHLNINPSYAPHRQKRRALNPDRYEALKDEVSKLIRSGFIREAIYPRWISNPVLVKKSSGKWRVCVDFTNLNKACPKDSFPLPRIDQLEDSTAGHELLSFMDALQAAEHVSHIDQTFQILRKYNMKLNPLKCTFGVASGQFLGYIVNQRGIDANPTKQGKRFQWTLECQEAFESLKKHLGEAPLLSKPHPDESLLLYLAVSDVAVSTVLTREENERQLSVYYISKALLPAETRYSDMEKLALALITASRKLRPYFQAHSIQVLTNFPLRQVMQKTDASRRLLKWAIELSEFDLTFRPRHAIKGQTLADFMVEFTKALEMEALMEPTEPPTWKLFVDGSSGEAGAGAKIVLESPEGHLLNCAVRFGFRASNNVAEYEALLAGLRLAKEIHVKKLLASSDSQLVVNQVNGDFAAKDDALSKLASSMNSELLNIVLIEHLSKPSTFEGEELLWIEGTPLWMQPIIAYLKEQTLLASRGEARKLRRRAAHFVLQEDTLYKRGFASPLLRCVGGEEATYILREIHEGIRRDGSGTQGSPFGIPHSIVSDNGRQCDNKKMRDLCDELGIKKDVSTSHHPQANGQVEAVNKTIKHTLKRKLDSSKGAWVDERPHVLWSIRTTCRTATGESPFSMTYGAEAMSPVEVGVPSHRRIHFNEISNDEARISELYLLEEKRETSQVTLAKYHRKMTRFYNSKVRNRTLRLGDLVLRRVFQSSKPTGSGVFGPNWEGPYRIRGEPRPGTYKIEDMSGKMLPHKWNIEHLRKYYQ